ncbi:MAG: 5-formyltetrahydrofolate cyclo-ligase [Myxococcales bacterium]|nr:5-formyltetrahydrofolate cyclo-ligase [Myxococcales bacterium]
MSTPPNADGPGNKAGIRARMLQHRAALEPRRCSAHSRALCERLLALPVLRGAACVAGYRAFRGEIDPASALAAAARRGARIALPRMDGAGELTLHAHSPDDSLARNRFGIEEPAVTSAVVSTVDVEVILVPAVAVDPQGHRLGFGRGFYARLLPRLPRARAIAVVHDFQVLEQVPADAHDVPMHAIVSEARTLHVGAT